MKKIIVTSLLVVGLAVGSSAAVFAQGGNTAPNNRPGYGNSMMGGGTGPNGNGGGYGYGMGPGMMGGNYGYGMGPGMMGGGYGYGMGPGMMGGGYGYGMGPGMMGGNYGYGMGPGMMGYSYGPNNCPGYGNRFGTNGNAWRGSEQVKKFLDQTVELRKKLNDKVFDYREALRKPGTSPETLAKLEKEIIDLRSQISEKAGALR